MTSPETANAERPRPLTSATSLGEWLDDAEGGALVRAAFARIGLPMDRLGPARAFSLERIVELSRGQLDAQTVADLVRAANGGRYVVADADAELAERRRPRPIRHDLALSEIQIRDPFLLTEPETGAHLLFGSTDPNIWDGPGIGFDAYRSSDLVTWSGPIPAFRPPADFWAPGCFWAPEVHRVGERWMMLATFTGPDGRRGTQVLASDRAEGPYAPWSDGPITPHDWQCLDGTLFIDDSQSPWIVYCREWTDVVDGEIHAQRLAHHLRSTIGEPVLLFRASAAPWTVPIDESGARVTDGPFLHRLADGSLALLWSSRGPDGYALGVAHSRSGAILGPWTQEDSPLWEADGGHGMIARLDHDSLVLVLHSPNDTPLERAVLIPIVEDGAGFRIERTRA